ncbi:MAG: hypothetical protein JST86_01790 [Bacteroidetes bacterium]|nr:hypothetical protein [Bacteroidota bacterium]
MFILYNKSNHVKSMKIIFIFSTIVTISLNVFAQQQQFDVLSFSVPQHWQQQQSESGMQLSVTDKKTGAYALAIITKATAAAASANDNFNDYWTRLVKSTVQVNDEPAMQDMEQKNGWDILSGSAHYTDGTNKGVATLLTATGGGQTVSVVLMTNSDQFKNELLAFIHSLELKKAKQVTNNASVTGLWTYYILETTGYYINNMPQYTSGYSRREYSFNADSTYIFRNKQWLVKAPNITFMYETGTYTVQGNQLILSPKNGKAGFWGKKSSTKEWGSLVKSSNYQLEKTTYTFEIIKDPTYGNSIVLKSTKPTQRDGGQFNNANEPYEFKYSFRTLASLVDNPPGWKN